MALENKLNITDSAALAREEERLERQTFMKGIDHSYYYEGYNIFKTENLKIDL